MIAAIADIIAPFVIGVSPLTLAALLLKKGLDTQYSEIENNQPNPQNLVEKAKLTKGMRETIEVQDGKIVVIPKKKYTLDELLANTNPSDYGGEIDWGNPVGNEEW